MLQPENHGTGAGDAGHAHDFVFPGLFCSGTGCLCDRKHPDGRFVPGSGFSLQLYSWKTDPLLQNDVL